MQDLPLSKNVNSSNKKFSASFEKENKAMIANVTKTKSSKSPARKASATALTSSSNRKNSDTMRKRMGSVGTNSSTNQLSFLSVSTRPDTDGSSINEMRREVEALRENLRIKDQELKDSLLCIEELQRTLQSSRDPLHSDFETNSGYRLTLRNNDGVETTEANTGVFGNFEQTIRSLRLQNKELKDTLQ